MWQQQVIKFSGILKPQGAGGAGGGSDIWQGDKTTSLVYHNKSRAKTNWP